MNNSNKVTIGILAHVDAGKTTLSEGILYQQGSIRSMGRVDHGDAFLDTYHLERARGITIFSKQAVFSLGDFDVTLLDTPGHMDFSAEMERTLQVLDYAILVINGADGVTGYVKTLWALLERYQVPVFLFVNKLQSFTINRVWGKLRGKRGTENHGFYVPIYFQSRTKTVNTHVAEYSTCVHKISVLLCFYNDFIMLV